jgi:hypothetical protein
MGHLLSRNALGMTAVRGTLVFPFRSHRAIGAETDHEEAAMSEFHATHAALFDELERQGVIGAVDVGRLTAAALRARATIAALPQQPPNPRCANGSCDE